MPAKHAKHANKEPKKNTMKRPTTKSKTKHRAKRQRHKGKDKETVASSLPSYIQYDPRDVAFPPGDPILHHEQPTTPILPGDSETKRDVAMLNESVNAIRDMLTRPDMLPIPPEADFYTIAHAFLAHAHAELHKEMEFTSRDDLVPMVNLTRSVEDYLMSRN